MTRYQLIIRDRGNLRDKHLFYFNVQWIYSAIVFSILIVMLLSFWLFNTVFSKWVNPLHYYKISSENFEAISNTVRDLETHARQNDQYITMLQDALNGKNLKVEDLRLQQPHKTDLAEKPALGVDDSSSIKHPANQRGASTNDDVSNVGKEYVQSTNYKQTTTAISKSPISFFPPTIGKIVHHYDDTSNPYGPSTSFSAPRHSPICCIADGVVIFSEFIESSGMYTTAILHNNSTVSIYRHKNMSRKKLGTRLYAGDVITTVEGSETSSEANLVFQLWIDLRTVNPEEYIVF